MGTRNDWANVGRGFKKLGLDVSKTIAKSVKAGAEKVDDWINEEGEKAEASSNTPPVETTATEVE